MNIVLLNDDFPPYGNSSVSGIVRDVAHGLRERGYTVTIITTHRTAVCPHIIRQEHVISFPVSYRLSLRHYLCLYNPSVARFLREEFTRLRPDVVHAHNVHMHLTYHALSIAKRFTPKVFITLHDVMSFSYARLTTQRFLASEGRDTRTTLIDHIRQAGLQWNPLRNWYIRRAIGKNTQVVFAVSHALKRALDVHRIPSVRVLHNFIDLKHWKDDSSLVENIRTRFHLQGRKVILFGGRLSRDKGTTPLLNALAMIRKTEPTILLLVLGKENRWEGLFREAGAEENLSHHVQCTGWLSPLEMRAAFAACDVVTTPSLCLDTFNLMNLEAMAARKSVVGTCFGGTPEVVLHGVTGLICNPLHTEEYATLLLQLLKNPTLAQEMGSAGRRRAEEVFSLDQHIDTLVEYYTRGQ